MISATSASSAVNKKDPENVTIFVHTCTKPDLSWIQKGKYRKKQWDAALRQCNRKITSSYLKVVTPVNPGLDPRKAMESRQSLTF